MRLRLSYIPILAALFMLCSMAGRAQVTVWSNIIDDTFVRANTSAGTAGTTTGAAGDGNWTDVFGSTYSINSNRLKAVDQSTYANNQLLRPAGENTLNGRVVVTTDTTSPTSTQWLAYFRYQDANNFYPIIAGSGSATAYKYVAGVLTSLGSLGSWTYTAGHRYQLDATCVGTSHPVLSAVITDLDAMGGPAVVATGSQTDLSDSFTTAGKMGIGVNGAGSTYYFSRAATYKRQSVALGTTIIGKNSTGNVINLTGENTAWNSTTPTFTLTNTGGTTASITAQNIIDNTHATVTVSGGTVAGTANIGDPSTGASAPVTISSQTITLSTVNGNINTSYSFTITGLFTTWTPGSTTVMSISGGAASITSQSATDATHVSITIATGGTAVPLTLTDTTSGATATFTVLQAVLVNDANFYTSPYNWFKSGSSYVQTNCTGAYCQLRFSGTAVKTTFDVTPMTSNSVSAGNYPIIRYSIDNGAWTSLTLTSATAQVTMATGLTAGNHRLDIQVTNTSYNVDRWNVPQSVVKITQFVIDGGSSSLAPVTKGRNILLFGDSLGEGSGAITSGVTDQQYSYLVQLARARGADYGNCSFSGGGWLFTSSSTTNPPLYNVSTPSNSKWDKYWAGQTRLVGGLLSPAPDEIWISIGTNDAKNSTDLTTAVSPLLTDLRTAAPNAQITVVIPFGQYASSQITSGFNSYQSTRDFRCYLLDPGTALQASLTAAGGTQDSLDGTHANAAGYALMAATLAKLFQQIALTPLHR